MNNGMNSQFSSLSITSFNGSTSHVFAGTFISKILATDIDEPGNINSQIAYKILEQTPGGEDMFHIDHDGNLLVKRPTLDREVHISILRQIYNHIANL